ncbi:MAG: DUF1080 domain-containing protein [Planctomycetes bacterium]|nr:DUF1080 domain-containing protein [Planctomycetota bacterium]
MKPAWLHPLTLLLLLAATRLAAGAQNALTPEERAAGWILLFDGASLDGWVTSARRESRVPVDDGAINPYRSGHYMMVYERPFSDFVLSLDFKISGGCNSGIFVRTSSLTARPGKDVGYNGIEVAIDAAEGAGYHHTGALYDLVKPRRQAMRPVGEWNHAVIVCDRGRIEVELNGEKVTAMDLDRWTAVGLRPDGTAHKFDVAYREHPRAGYIGLQDHGAPCWFKNIKLKPLSAAYVPLPEEDSTLFDGRDLTGWRGRGGRDGAWSVEGGEVVCRLKSEAREAEVLLGDVIAADASFSAEVKVSPGSGKGGVALRSSEDARGGGQGIFAEAEGGEWTRCEVLAAGRDAWAAAGGRVAAAVPPSGARPSGRVALLVGPGPPREVRFRALKLVHNPRIELAGKTEAELRRMLAAPAASR